MFQQAIGIGIIQGTQESHQHGGALDILRILSHMGAVELDQLAAPSVGPVHRHQLFQCGDEGGVLVQGRTQRQGSRPEVGCLDRARRARRIRRARCGAGQATGEADA